MQFPEKNDVRIEAYCPLIEEILNMTDKVRNSIVISYESIKSNTSEIINPLLDSNILPLDS